MRFRELGKAFFPRLHICRIFVSVEEYVIVDANPVIYDAHKGACYTPHAAFLCRVDA